MNDEDKLITDISDEEMQQLIEEAQKSVQRNEELRDNDPDLVNGFNDETAVDEYGMPFEPESFYNGAPLQYEEEAQMLWFITSNMHYAATRYNRHSPNYYLLCTELEKNIKRLGSCCITKAVLEKDGSVCELLKDLSIEELYCMVSLHFRKCSAAYMDIQEAGGGQDLNVIRWIFRWAELADRLRATQEKIEKIRDGRISVESLLCPAKVFEGETRMREDMTEKTLNPIRKAKALPVNKSYANMIREQKREEEKEAERRKREMERAAKRAEKNAIKVSETYHVPVYRAKPIPIDSMKNRCGPSDRTRKKRKKRKK